MTVRLREALFVSGESKSVREKVSAMSSGGLSSVNSAETAKVPWRGMKNAIRVWQETKH